MEYFGVLVVFGTNLLVRGIWKFLNVMCAIILYYKAVVQILNNT